MKIIRNITAGMILSIGFSSATFADPISVIDVSGPDTDFLQVDGGQSAGVGFTLGQSFLDVLITPEFFCLTCSGQLLLMQDTVGPGALLTDLLAAADFSNGFAPTLSAGNLDAGTYFFVLLIQSGFGGWTGTTDSANIHSTTGNAYEISLFADETNTDTTFAGRSSFSALFDFDLYFDVTGSPVSDPVTVPEPSTILLMLAGFFATYIRRRSPASAG